MRLTPFRTRDEETRTAFSLPEKMCAECYSIPSSKADLLSLLGNTLLKEKLKTSNIKRGMLRLIHEIPRSKDGFIALCTRMTRSCSLLSCKVFLRALFEQWFARSTVQSFAHQRFIAIIRTDDYFMAIDFN